MSGASPDNTPTSQSGLSSKRASPPPLVTPAMKRLKSNSSFSMSDGVEGQGSIAGQGGAPGHTAAASASTSHANTVDPDLLSDALLSAGVDLKEEENLLSSTLPVSISDSHHGDMNNNSIMTGSSSAGFSSRYNVPPAMTASTLLDQRRLQQIIRKLSTESGIKYVYDKDSEIVTLLSLSCEEWLSGIISDAALLSKHRRRSRNNVHSNLSKSLRTLAVKDKEAEEKRLARRAALGLDASGTVTAASKLGSEETQHRAANATALMMTSGKKKYSWLSGSSSTPSGNRSPAGLNVRSDGGIRIREAREEQGLVLRDLLGALEDRRIGVESSISKGYSKLRN